MINLDKHEHEGENTIGLTHWIAKTSQIYTSRHEQDHADTNLQLQSATDYKRREVPRSTSEQELSQYENLRFI